VPTEIPINSMANSAANGYMAVPLTCARSQE